MVFQLVYSSAARVEFDEQSLVELLETARRNNAKLDVTGMLLFAEGSFLQVLEGDESVVMDLYRKIQRDRRHSHARILLKTELEERIFFEWTMGFERAQSLSELPLGMTRFMQRGATSVASRNQALKMLRAFREGRWRAE